MHAYIHTRPPSLDALQIMAGGARKGWLTTLVNVLKLNVFDLLSLGSNEYEATYIHTHTYPYIPIHTHTYLYIPIHTY